MATFHCNGYLIASTCILYVSGDKPINGGQHCAYLSALLRPLCDELMIGRTTTTTSKKILLQTKIAIETPRKCLEPFH